MKRLDLDQLKKEIGFIPNPWQKTALSKLKRFTKIVGGKRCGKSFLSSYLAIRELMASDREIWVVAPTNELATRVWDRVEVWARMFPRSLKARKQDLIKGRSIENPLANSILRIKSADIPTQLKGQAGDLVIIEEAGDMSEDVWPSYLEPFISEIRPATGKKGNAVFIGNASAKGSWFHRKWAEEDDEQNASFWIPTAIERDGSIVSTNNPLVDVAELRRIKSGLPERIWRQEWMAEWLIGSGEVFRGVREIATGSYKEPEGHFYYIGVDLGRLKDFTVITVVDAKTWEVVHWDRFKDIEWPFQKMRIVETAKRFGVYNTKLMVDQTGIGQSIVDELQREGLNVEGFLFTNESKKDLIEKLSVLIENKKIRYPEIPELLQELEVFTFKTLASNKVQYGAPAGLHDDCVISLALGCFMLDGEPILTEERKPGPSEIINIGSKLNFSNLLKGNVIKRNYTPRV